MRKSSILISNNLIKHAFLILVFFLGAYFNSHGQNTSYRKAILDIDQYTIALKISDSNNLIEVNQTIRFHWLDTSKQITLDLSSVDSDGKGMVVKEIIDGKSEVAFTHSFDQLILNDLKSNGRKEIELKLVFSGIPADGLVIGKNKYGSRTFFGDNWPNRAHEWFACIDHPSDKALVNFRVQVPRHYQVIANGNFVGKELFNSTEVIYEYASNVPLPTKVIVVGIAEFVVKDLGVHNNVPISSWAYPQNSEKAFFDLDLAPKVLAFFEDYIGSYEYEKLANVQSTTRFGGMENAGCIFYDEHSLNGKRTSESLIAHEIAHQWFGNSATEKEWQHIWLSEGFATYFTNLYLEKTYGKKALDEQLEKDRTRVVKFYPSYPNPIVESNYKELMHLLNANSYQKGAWILHMLRRKLGDEVFQKGIVSYYQTYRLSNANTADFQREMEQVSGQDLTSFFQQWLYTAGHPQLKMEATITKKKTIFTITQMQIEGPFSFPLTIQLEEQKCKKATSAPRMETINIDQKSQTFEFKTNRKIKSWKLDPNLDLLFELVK